MQKLWYHQCSISTLEELSESVTSLNAIFLPLMTDVHYMKQSSLTLSFSLQKALLRIKKCYLQELSQEDGPQTSKAEKKSLCLLPPSDCISLSITLVFCSRQPTCKHMTNMPLFTYLINILLAQNIWQKISNHNCSMHFVLFRCSAQMQFLC